MLWRHWWKIVRQLRPACTRTRTFLWMVTCIAGMTVHNEWCEDYFAGSRLLEGFFQAVRSEAEGAGGFGA